MRISTFFLTFLLLNNAYVVCDPQTTHTVPDYTDVLRDAAQPYMDAMQAELKKIVDGDPDTYPRKNESANPPGSRVMSQVKALYYKNNGRANIYQGHFYFNFHQMYSDGTKRPSLAIEFTGPEGFWAHPYNDVDPQNLTEEQQESYKPELDPVVNSLIKVHYSLADNEQFIVKWGKNSCVECKTVGDTKTFLGGRFTCYMPVPETFFEEFKHYESEAVLTNNYKKALLSYLLFVDTKSILSEIIPSEQHLSPEDSQSVLSGSAKDEALKNYQIKINNWKTLLNNEATVGALITFISEHYQKSEPLSIACKLKNRAAAQWGKQYVKDNPDMQKDLDDLLIQYASDWARSKQSLLPEALMCIEMGPSKEALSKALIEAVCNDNEALVRALVDNGADIDFKDPRRWGRTPLISAAHMDDNTMIAVLMYLKANVNAQSDQGETALEIAASYGDVSTVDQLLAAGALDNDGRALKTTQAWMASEKDDYDLQQKYVKIIQLLNFYEERHKAQKMLDHKGENATIHEAPSDKKETMLAQGGHAR